MEDKTHGLKLHFKVETLKHYGGRQLLVVKGKYLS